MSRYIPVGPTVRNPAFMSTLVIGQLCPLPVRRDQNLCPLSPLNVTVNLVQTSSKSSKSPPPLPTFYIDANTFNAPLTLSVIQDPLPSSPAIPVFIHATNNLDATNVTLDKYFEGIFFAQTEYASTTILDGSFNSHTVDLDSINPVVDASGRTLDIDNSSTDSQIGGWIGRGTRPPISASSSSSAGAPGCLQVLSVLSPVNVNFGS